MSPCPMGKAYKASPWWWWNGGSCLLGRLAQGPQRIDVRFAFLYNISVDDGLAELEFELQGAYTLGRYFCGENLPTQARGDGLTWRSLSGCHIRVGRLSSATYTAGIESQRRSSASWLLSTASAMRNRTSRPSRSRTSHTRKRVLRKKNQTVFGRFSTHARSERGRERAPQRGGSP
jgi:hypothetical protein